MDDEFSGWNLVLVKQVKTIVEDEREEHAIDGDLENFPTEEVKAVFNIAMKCLDPEPITRPTMAEVLKMLELIKADQSSCESPM